MSERVAELWVPHADGTFSVGSGFLVCKRVVITAAHVIDESCRPAKGTPVKVRFSKSPRLWEAESIWHAVDTHTDVALTLITDDDWPEQVISPMRWGRLTCMQTEVPAQATGYPEVLEQPTKVRESFQLSGRINPGSGTKLHQYYVAVANPPTQPESWAGMSGAALFSEDILIGIVISVPEGFAGGQLIATPIRQVFSDAAFTAAIKVPERPALVLESAELADMFVPPLDNLRPIAPAALLRADAEAVRWFSPRDQQLEDLLAWCRNSSGMFEAQLIFGNGGIGKTRLARRLARCMQAEDWVTGWVQAENADALPTEPLARLSTCELPMLLVVDYAETRPDVVRKLVEKLGQPTGVTVRMLMLARSSGQWWQELSTRSALLGNVLSSTMVGALTPLPDDPDIRKKAFDEAVADMAARLDQEQVHPEVAWADLPEHVEAPELSGPEYKSILRVQLAALVGLLQASSIRVDRSVGLTPEAVLMMHESRYWRLRADATGLAGLSDSTLANAVTVATLLRAANNSQAIAILARVQGLDNSDQNLLGKVAAWLSSLYPGPDGRGWSPLEPDPLGEYLVASHLIDWPDLLDEPFNAAQDEQLFQAFHVLARASAEHAHVGDILKGQIARQFSRYGPVALRVVVETEQPAYLIAALEEGISNADTVDVATLSTLADAFPTQAPVLAEFIERLFRLAIMLYRRLQAEASEDYRKQLALAWERLSQHLSDNGRVEEAAAAQEVAVQVLLELSGRDLAGDEVTVDD
jgi:hypothetical protein